MSPLLRRAAFGLTLVAAALSVSWAGTSVVAAFNDSAAVGANSFTTSATWGAGCTSPGSSTLMASADAWTDQASTAQNKGTDSNLFVLSKSGNANRRSLVKFTLPALPAGCAVTASTLRLYNSSPVGGRVIGAYEAAATPAWTETGVTWANSPATAGTAATSTAASTAGWQTWTVTTQVQAQYAGPNSGFVIRDQTETSAAGPQQSYISREGGATLRPELIVTRG